MVYFESYDGNFKIFSSSNFFYDDMVIAVGKLQSTSSFLSSPVVVGNVIYIGSTDGNSYGLMCKQTRLARAPCTLTTLLGARISFWTAGHFPTPPLS